MSEEEIKIDIVELGGKIDRMIDNLHAVRERCDEIAVCVNKVKKAVYEPDQGLYARLRELEQWKEQASRFLWVITTSVVGLITATLYKALF
jgi:hypothetical protein